MRRLSAILLALVLSPPVAADTVRLTNGRTFENVATRSDSTGLWIRFEYGEMRLAPSMIASVERGESDLDRFLAWRQRLSEPPYGSPSDWLELASWAERVGLEDGARKAALEAARLAPDLPELAPLLHRFGYVRDESSGAWILYADWMRGRGYVNLDGGWVTGEEARRRSEDAERRRREERRADLDERVSKALELLVLSEVAQRRGSEPAGGGPALLPYPVGVFPGFVPVLPVARPHPEVERRNREVFEALSRRQPGSLLTVEAGRHHRGRVESPD